MNTYEEMYGALFELCKKEGLTLIEAELDEKEIIYERRENTIILNKNTNQLLR